MSRYLRSLASTITAGVLAVVLVNAAVDPYGLLATPATEGWTAPKTEIHRYARLVRAHDVCVARPAAVAVGFSDVALGIDPAHPGWSARPVYNLGLTGWYMHELRRNFEHACAQGRLRQAIVSLDLGFFDEHPRVPGDFDESRLGTPGTDDNGCGTPFEHWKLLVSIDTLYSSAATVLKNAVRKPSIVEARSGLWEFRREEEVWRRNGGASGVFALTLRQGLYDNVRKPIFAQGENAAKAPGIEDLRAIADVAFRYGVDLRIFLAPVHVYLVETRRALGLEADYERWVRAIVETLAAQAAKHPGAGVVPIWDFGGYNSVTSEEVPPAGDSSPMRWYRDPAHYNVEVGNWILDRVLEAESPQRAIPIDFGARLTRDNVDEILARRRDAGSRYRETHAREIVWIEAMVRDVLDWRSRRAPE